MSSTSLPPPLRTAVVGLGRIGYGFHVPSLRADHRFELVAVSDPLAERRAEATANWSVPGFGDLPELLDAIRPDLVVLASPTPFHAGQASAAFAAGADVFCEKPVARSVSEFDAMTAAAVKWGRKLVPYQPRRYAPDVQVVKRMLRSGRLGPIHLIRRARCSYERRRDWQAFRANGGGMLNNYGSHCLDELLWIMEGEPIRSVYCQLRSAVTAGDAEDVVVAVLTMESGLIFDLQISQAAALGTHAWQLFGQHGAAQFDEDSQTFTSRFFAPDEIPIPSAEQGLAAEGRRYRTENLPWRTVSESLANEPPFNYYDALWRHLVRNERPPVSLSDARALLELIERCRVSAETGEVR
ncbi:MAG: Gfo/Idh/MocA family oxidoreductase [Opitutus sp.]